MTNKASFKNLLDAKTIGKYNFAQWSKNAGLGGRSEAPEANYLNVLPRPLSNIDIKSGWGDWKERSNNHSKGKLKFRDKQGNLYFSWGPEFQLIDNSLSQHSSNIDIKSGWLDWQQANSNHAQGKFEQTNSQGTFYSSWGPEFQTIDIDLSLATQDNITVDGFGEIRTREDFSASVYDNEFWVYNEMTPGPVIVADPGDTIRVKLTNNLNLNQQTKDWNSTVERTNLHLHGAHVSPEGKGDNVMIAVENGDSQEYIYQIPENHPSGLLWMHPHLHGATSLSLAGGAALPVFILPDSEDANNIESYDPTSSNIHLLSLQSWAVEQDINQNIQQGANNWENTKQMPPRLFKEDGEAFFKYASAPFNGNNYQPLAFFEDNDYWAPGGGTYADYVAVEPTENLIHTVNGQYNPTINAKTGEWVTFGFLNFSLNSSHVIQLVHADEDGNLTIESPNLLGLDSDISRWSSEYDTTVTTLPGISPGGRITIQHSFNKPGNYYFISNASEEVLGELAPIETNRPKNASDTYLGYNDGFQITPSQVLATVDVTRGKSSESKQPEAWSYLDEQRDHALGLKVEAENSGVTKSRNFTWNTNPSAINREADREHKEAPNGTDYVDPGYNDPESWEGVWTINQQYWTHKPTQSPTITISMLDTLERWSLINSSASVKRDTFPENDPETQIQIGQSHPFHLHQNEFIVESINGLKVDGNPAKNQVGDSYSGDSLIDVFQMGPAYAKGSATSDNPFGTPMILDEKGNYIDGYGTNYGLSTDGYLTNSQTDILVRFEDYTGLFVDHCHLLFHEDGGMMVPVLAILNTNDSWVTSASSANNKIDLSLGSNRNTSIQIQAFTDTESNGINVASGDINALNFTPGPKSRTVNVSDNIEDIAVIEATSSNNGQFKLNIFDGQSTKDFYSNQIRGLDPNFDSLEKLSEMTVTAKAEGERENLKSSIAIGDINGDGFDDVVVGISGSNYKPEIRVYSGKNYEELYCLNPFDGALSNGIDISIGDINGDNYGDIIVSQLEGGQGLVDGFNGKLLTDHASKSMNSGMLSDMSKLWNKQFNPHGQTSNAVRIAVGYSLPDDQPSGSDYKFMEGMHNQTYLANLSTIEVVTDSITGSTQIKNWLYSSSDGAHAGHGSSDDQDKLSMMGPMDNMNSLEMILPEEILANGLVSTNNSYTDIDFNYFDIDSDQRGEGGLLLTNADGTKTLIHLKASGMGAETSDFDVDYFSWLTQNSTIN